MPPKYKPGGRKFPKKITSIRNTATSATVLPPSSSASAPVSASSSSPNVLDPEVEDQLEIELCWCIQQLETSLGSGKLNERQTLDATKTLSVLKSSTAPLIKKRQFMRTTFGDYRTKMANDQKKLGKTSSQVKFSDANITKKSMFVKKAVSSSAATKNNGVDQSEDKKFRIIVPNGENNFKFNFNSNDINDKL